MNATTFLDLGNEVTIPENGSLSRTLYQDDDIKVVLFGFAAGQELMEHMHVVPAVLHFLEGVARVTLGAEVVEAHPHTWIHIPARLPHSIRAETPVKMLVSLLKGQGAPQA
ncbi:MAG: cupin domain-containing protein [Acidobacteriota bacterium]